MIRVAAAGKVLALAFSHPTYSTTHKVEGKDVVRTSRKTTVTIFDVTTEGFKERATAEVKVHWKDNFDRAKGRVLALRKLLDPKSPTFTVEERTAIWFTYWNRDKAEQIRMPKPPQGGGGVTPFPSPVPQQASFIHRIVSYLM